MRSILIALLSIFPLLSTPTSESVSPRLATGFLPQPSAGKFWAMASSFRAAFDNDGIRLVRHGRQARLRFPGAMLLWEGEGPTLAQVNFLNGESRSASGVSALRARNAYPGVDLVVRLQDGRLKSEFQLAPGVPVSKVGYCVEGASVRSSNDGQSLNFDAGDEWQWAEKGLETWQTGPAGERLKVTSRFDVQGQCVRFQTGALDPTLPVTIDPELVFSSFMGGGMYDAITSIATDAQGNTYLGGWTESADFPTLSGYQATSGGRIDGFVAKVNPAGQLVFSTYFGGYLEDRVQAIAVDSTGALAIAGLTTSSNFPVKLATQSTFSGGRDAFVARLAPAGNQLVFSTYIGGTAYDAALAIALDPSGNIVAAGETSSTNFPVLSAYRTTNSGGVDGFVARISASGSLISSTYFGGAADDRIRGVAVSSDGVIHLTGNTASTNFPAVAAPYPSLRGSMDAFYSRLNAAATTVTLSTYLGGGAGSSLSEETGYGITIDSQSRAWIGGVTPSTDFPGVSGGAQTVYGGGPSDGFVTVFTAAGALQWSTYYGAGGLDAITSTSAGSGFVGVAGYTTSNNLSVTAALQPSRSGEYDAFWAVFPIASTAPLAASYLGGTGSDSALAVSASGSSLSVGGSTLSANFPLQSPIQSSNPGAFGGFLTRLRFGPGAVAVSPSSGQGTSQTFTLMFSNASGGASIQNAAFLINSTYSFSGGCYIYFDRPNNRVSLFKDAGSVWLNITLGSTATADNGVCSISGAGLTVSNTSNSLVMNIPVTFSSTFAGSRLLFANATDSAGLGAGWPQVGTWTVPNSSAPPVFNSLTPNSGTGSSQTFTLTVSDPNGYADISSVLLLLNSSLTQSGGCYFSYQRGSNTIYLLRDSDTLWQPLTPGSAGTVENANCSIKGTGLTVTPSGNSVTLTLPLTFKSGFTGSKNFYVLVSDAGNLSPGWVIGGSWSPSGSPPAPPAFNSLTPSSGTGSSQTFTLTVSDPNGYADISSVLLLLNSSLTQSGGCYLSYQRGSNTIYLLRDSDTLWQPLTPGSASTVDNANCSITGTGLTVAPSGNSLTLTLPLTFKSGFTGSKNFYVLVSDAGNLSPGWVIGGSWSPSGPPAAPPAFNSLTPSSGTASSQTFTLTVSDPNGNADISSVLLLLNSSLTQSGGCYLSYQRGSNMIYLLRDSDTLWQPLTPGSGGTVETPNCSISGTGLAVTPSGNSLTLTLPLTFKPAFTGSKNFYVLVSDTGNLSPGWVVGGSWSPSGPPAAPPAINSLTPNSGTGSSQAFTLTVSDPNGYADLSSVLFLLNSSLTQSGGCYLSYQRGSNTIYLLRDSDTLWQPLTPGSASTVENANCSITGTGLTVTPSGNSLTLTLPLAFKPSFTGTKNLYALVSDVGNLSPGWIIGGAWTPR